MKNVRIKVIESCSGATWWFAICEGRKLLMDNSLIRGNCTWVRKFSAIRNAKAMAKRIGIKYDPQIVKQHGC